MQKQIPNFFFPVWFYWISPFCAKYFAQDCRKVIMASDERIRYENVQCGVNREAVKVSAFPLHKIDKYESFTVKEILPAELNKIE